MKVKGILSFFFFKSFVSLHLIIQWGLEGVHHFPLPSNHVRMRTFTSNEGSSPSFILVLINILKDLGEEALP
jgi:hypothetical protein